MRLPYLLLALFLVGVAFADTPYPLFVELVDNQPVPELGGVLSYWDNPRTNTAGDIVFRGGVRIGSGETAAYLSGIFLKRYGVIRPVLLAGDTLPDGEGPLSFHSSALALFNIGEDGSVAIVIQSGPRGVLLYNEHGLRWLARQTTVVPGLSLSGAVFRGVIGLPANEMDPLLLPGNQVVFQATLADQSGCLLVANENGVQHALPGGFYWDGRGTRFGVAAGIAHRGFFLLQNDSLTAVELVDQTLRDGYRVKTIQEVDVNSAGNVILAVEVEKNLQREPRILHWSPSTGVETVVHKASSFPAPHLGVPYYFTHLTLAETGAFSFVTNFDSSPSEGIYIGASGMYIFDGGLLTKVVADGDASPLGGSLYLYHGRLLVTGLYPNRIFYDSVATRELDIAFTATLQGTNLGRPVFLWSGGSLIPLAVANQPVVGLDSEQTQNFDIEHNETPPVIVSGPRLLLTASTRDFKRRALLSTAPQMFSRGESQKQPRRALDRLREPAQPGGPQRR